MVAQQQIGPIGTVEQYLVRERHSTVKHVYHGAATCMRWLAAGYAVIHAAAERTAWLGRTRSPFRRGRLQLLEEDQQVPNRFTRVPDRPVPPLPWLGRMVLPLADLFMILMASRPRSGSLRTTWVTPATVVLCMVAVVAGVLLDALVLRVGVGGRSVPALIGAAVVAVLVVGSACVAVIGIVQRR